MDHHHHATSNHQAGHDGQNQMEHTGHIASCLHFMISNFEITGSTAPYIINTSLNVPLSILAATSSLFVLLAIRKTRSLHLPSKLLLFNLVLTDLAVGAIAQPLFVIFLLAKVVHHDSTSCVAYAAFSCIGALLNCSSLLTMTAISVDRYVSLHYYLDYQAILTAKRVSLVVAISWCFSGLYAFLRLWFPMSHSYLIIAVCCFSFLVTCVAYTKVYAGLRRQSRNQTQLQSRTEGHGPRNTMNVAKFRRSASGMVWIYGIFFLCYLPYVVAKVVKQSVGHIASVQLLIEYTLTIVCSNSFLNPIIYYLYLPAIRSGVKRRIRGIFGRYARRIAVEPLSTMPTPMEQPASVAPQIEGSHLYNKALRTV